MMRPPDFFIIGAMKSATTTLYAQLVQQPGLFLCKPKEPNFFSDDQEYKKGISYYQSLFSTAAEGDLLGDASTHYTKLPTYPETVPRILQDIQQAKFVYIMRHPIDRLVSQYIHRWSQNIIKSNIDAALDSHPSLIDYSCYHKQLHPYIEAFGQAAILPVFFDHLRSHPQHAFERICAHIGYSGKPHWYDQAPEHVSKEKIRKFPLYNVLVESRSATWLRHHFLPKSLRQKIRSKFTMNSRPVLSSASLSRLEALFNDDLEQLEALLTVDHQLTCDRFKEVTRDKALEWK